MSIQLDLRSKRVPFLRLTILAIVLPLALEANADAFALQGGTTISPDDARIVVLGRYDATDPKRPRLAFPGVTIRLRFTGDSLLVTLSSDIATSAVDISVDGAEPRAGVLQKGVNDVLITAPSLDAHDSSSHTESELDYVSFTR